MAWKIRDETEGEEMSKTQLMKLLNKEKDDIEIYLGLTKEKSCIQARIVNVIQNGDGIQINAEIFAPDNIRRLVKDNE